MKNFVVRIDLESDRGIREGLPRLLDLFKKHNILGSFYLTMGGESNIFEILENRGPMKGSAKRKIKIWSFWDKLRIVLFPKKFVRRNKDILKRILEEDHELGLHGYKHRVWTRNLGSLDLNFEIKRMVEEYNHIFGVRPISFAAPGFNTNNKVLRILEMEGIRYISDFLGRKNYGKLKNIPIEICGLNRMPFIEYHVGEGKSDKEIINEFKKEIKGKNFVSFYLHGLFEGRFKIDLVEKMILELKKNKFQSKRVIDF